MPSSATPHLQATADYIAGLQLPSGAIPWFENSIVDPWDHVEAAMGLAIGGYIREARRAYRWLKDLQRDDGSWLAAYRDDQPADATRAETNFVAYIATGVWHQYLVTNDTAFLRELWPCVRKACDFVLQLQTRHGDIHWAVDTEKGIDKDALVTGCSSIYLSLACAANIARQINEPYADLLHAQRALGQALRDKPERFDRTWESKARYSMDWFYPVLTGAIRGRAATHRLAERWDEFVEPNIGCRCVSDEPWVTIAETCELTMALCVNGQRLKARRLFEDIARFQNSDGSWWTGYVTRDDALWPDERPTWTAGAVLLAADTIFRLTPGHRLFR